MKYIIILIFVFSISLVVGSEEILVTKDGRKVVLHDNKTWDYLLEKTKSPTINDFKGKWEAPTGNFIIVTDSLLKIGMDGQVIIEFEYQIENNELVYRDLTGSKNKLSIDIDGYLIQGPYSYKKVK